MYKLYVILKTWTTCETHAIRHCKERKTQMKEIIVAKMVETEFSRGFNHCIGKEETKKGSCKECVKADVCYMKDEREELTAKVAEMVDKFTVEIQCPHFYKAQIQLR